jgi:outer membrane immunogenic protein
MRTHVRAMLAIPLVLALASSATPAIADSDQLPAWQPPIWTGTYVGLQGGMNWLDVSIDPLGSYALNGGFGGGHVGFNYQFGTIVAGAEADVNLETGETSASANGASYGFPNATASAHSAVTSSGSVRARAGIPLGQTLVYATAGYSWTNIEFDAKAHSGTTSVNYSSGFSFDGLVYGAGAETFITQNITFRLEVLHTDYAAKPLSIRGHYSGVDFDPSSDAVRAGVSWHFN